MSDYFDVAADLPPVEKVPGYSTARRKLRDIRRILRHLEPNESDIAQFRALWNVALEKEDNGRQCVLFVDDLIEQNTPLKW